MTPVREDRLRHVEDTKMLQRSSEQRRTHLKRTELQQQKRHQTEIRTSDRSEPSELCVRACVCVSCRHLLQGAVAVGQIQCVHTVWVTQEAMQVLSRGQKHIRHQQGCSNRPSQVRVKALFGGVLCTGRSSPRNEFPDRSSCVRAEATAGLLQRA